MRITSVHVKHFRCIANATLVLDDLTVLVGANGVGKSTFLQALDFFYRTEASVGKDDFFNHDTTTDIEITLSFAGLSHDAAEKFARYVEDNTMTVSRVAHWQGDRCKVSYHGVRFQIPAFQAIRLAGSPTNMRPLYETVATSENFRALPAWRSQPQALEALAAFENANPTLCERLRDEGAFFGFTEVASGYLGQYTRFVLIPAVRDASVDATEGKTSPLTSLIDIAVRSNTEGDEELLALASDTTARYEEIIARTKGDDLKALSDDLASALSEYVVASDVVLSWGPLPTISLSTPKAVVQIGEDGHLSDIERKGHGLQRAYIMALLQYLERRKSTVSQLDTPPPHLVFGIEEPELFQHPDRQRHMAKVLRALATGDHNDSSGAQVLYCTHSPHFVGLDRFDSIRLVRKVSREDGIPPATMVTQATLDDVARRLESLCQESVGTFSGASLRVRLHTLMTPWMNEGFFAKLVILTEGESDRAAILAAAEINGRDLEAMGIAVIPCGGKTNIDRVALVFQALEIPVYLIWDSDEGRRDPKTEVNRRLLRLVGVPEEDYPSFVGRDAAAFRVTIETTLQEDMGEDYDSLVTALQASLELERHDVLKNPVAMAKLLRDASARDKHAATLSAIVDAIIAIRGVSV